MITVSTVTPVYAGREYLERLIDRLDRLRRHLESHAGQVRLVECIFVSDGAEDGSEEVLSRAAAEKPWVRFVALSRNYGQHNATVAGILYSTGDWVVTMDEDLQHPPERVIDLLKLAAEQSADIVLAKSSKGTHDGGYRDFMSRFAKKLVGWLSGSDMTHAFSSFRLIRGPIARAAAAVCSHQTYFDAALTWFTRRMVSCRMDLSDLRYQAGRRSGYSLLSLLSHGKRLIISSNVRYFRLSVVISGVSFLLAVLLESWVLLSYWFDSGVADAPGWGSLMSVVLLYGGVTSLLLGLVLEIVSTVMFHSQGKPTFFVVSRDTDSLLAQEMSRVPDLDA